MWVNRTRHSRGKNETYHLSLGAGKTTIARELVASSQDPIAYIEGECHLPRFA
jgi:hypothetical protein